MSVKSGGSRDRYRIGLRLGQKDEALLGRLEGLRGLSRNAVLVEALRHFYWTVVIKELPAWTYLPPDVTHASTRAARRTRRRAHVG